MKVLLKVMTHAQVVEELLEAMSKSIDRFSQDRSFDFRLVRIDKFLVPPKYVESHDDACSSFFSKDNPHPPSDQMKSILLKSREKAPDKDVLCYAAVPIVVKKKRPFTSVLPNGSRQD